MYGLLTINLRFFTVYGPLGRPYMALFKFIKVMLAGESIQVLNQAKHLRDFAHIVDIVESVISVLDQPAVGNPACQRNSPYLGTSLSPWRMYNIGNNQSVELMDHIAALEKQWANPQKYKYYLRKPVMCPIPTLMWSTWSSNFIINRPSQ